MVSFQASPGFRDGGVGGVQGATFTRALANPEDFVEVSADAPKQNRKVSGTARDTSGDDRAAFVVRAAMALLLLILVCARVLERRHRHAIAAGE